MLIIQQITDDTLQQQNLVLPDGSVIFLQIYFRPMQQGWFINKLTYKDFVLCGVRITNSPNILHQWKNILPFGLACYSTDNREPSLQEDFASGASKLYILQTQDLAEFEEFLNNG